MKTFIPELAKNAGALAMEFYNGIRPNEVHSKATANDLVSIADGQVERLIIDTIRKRFPDHGIFGEETGQSNTGSEYRWVIDPIDGTQSFVKKHVYFSVSIAFQKNGQTIAAAVYAPALNQLFFAEKGKGSVLNGTPIHVSSCERLEDAFCSTGFACLRAGLKHNGLPLFNALMPHIRAMNRCGSAALDLCNIACGTYDGYWEYSLKPYDVAAGVLIAREAGAVIHDYFGGEEYPEKGLLASNPALMPQLLEYTKHF